MNPNHLCTAQTQAMKAKADVEGNHLGSASFITDASGEAVQHLQYLPFGESFVTQTSQSWESRYTFSGKEKDVETGYSYFGARYYDSDISVWLSVDPLASQYPNESPYCYAGWNPVMIFDPNGMWKANIDNDGNITYVAEEGDNMQTFQRQYGVSEEDTKKIFGYSDSKLEFEKVKIDGKDINLNYYKEGSSVTGKAVGSVTGNEVLKLDLNSEMATDQRIFDQFLFATLYSNSKGEVGFFTTQFYRNVYTGNSNISGKAKLSNGTDVAFDLLMYDVFGAGYTSQATLRATYICNTPSREKITEGTLFGKNTSIFNLDFEFAFKFNNQLVWQKGASVRISTPKKNTNIVSKLFNWKR